MVRCDHEHEGNVDCGGWGDRLKSIVSGYWLAMLTNRSLIIRMNRPCNLNEIFEPNELNWNVEVNDEIIKQKKIRSKFIKLMNPKYFKEKLETTKTTRLKYFDDDRFKLIILLTNRNFADALANNKMFAERFQRLGIANQSLVQLKYSFDDIYRRLFKFTPSVQQKYDRFVQRAKPYGANSTLICIHIRLGQHRDERNSWRKVDVTYQQRQNSELYWEFVYKNFIIDLQLQQKPYKIFLNTDTEEIYDEALRKYGNETLVTNEGGYFNIDLLRQRDSCGDVEKTYLDFHAFELCDMSVITHSQFSKIGLWRLKPASKRHWRNFSSKFYVFNRNRKEFLPINSVYDFQID
jgi:hypothetical protein